MKKYFVKALSIGMAMVTMITLLVASMLPVSAATPISKSDHKTIDDSLGNELKGYLGVQYIPPTDGSNAIFQEVYGSAYLYTGDTAPCYLHTVYLIAASGVKYSSSTPTQYVYSYKTIEDMEANTTYGLYSKRFLLDQTKYPSSFHHISKLSHDSELFEDDNVNGLQLTYYKHRSQILTQ